MKYLWIIGLGWALLLPAALAAQENAVQVAARLNRVQITVGDLLTYELRVTAPAGYELEIPPMPQTNFGEWEVHECTNHTSAQTDDSVQHGWTCSLTIWDVGYHTFPTQIVRYTAPDGLQDRATTQPLAVEVASVLDENATDIKPLKPQLIMTEQANYLLILGLSLLSVLVAGFVVWSIMYYRRHRPLPAAVAPIVSARDPIAAALEELDRIAALDLVAQDRIVDHYSLIADVLRRFIADRFSIPALERTTGEVRMAMAHPSFVRRREVLLALLAEGDGVKFARRLPTHTEAYELLEHARQAILAVR